MAQGIFSLREVRTEQVKGAANNNNLNWPEINFYGYFVGGYPNTNNIARLDFPSETISNPGKNLPNSRYGMASVSNASYAYFGGGYTPAYLSTITRFDFSNEVVSEPGKHLPSARYMPGGTQHTATGYAYFGGGIYPTTTCIISRLDLSSETASDPGKNLTTTRGYASATSSAYYAYFGGGQTPATDTINRIDYFTDNVTNIPNNLQYAAYGMVATASGSSGYFVGGFSPTYNSNINRFNFSTETIDYSISPLPTAKYLAAATSSGLRGYFGGGNNPAVSNAINLLDYTTDTSSNLPAILPTSRGYFTATAGGASVALPNKTVGYFLGGNTPLGMNNTYQKFTYSTETFGGATVMPVTRGWAAFSGNNRYAYFGGGYSSFTVPKNAVSQILRLEYSNDSFTTLSSVLGFSNLRGTAVYNSNYGYYANTTGPASVSRLDYGTETTSNPSKTIPGGQAASGYQASSPNYGYFGGGYSADVKRLDFLTDSFTSVPNVTPGVLSHASYVTGQNNLYYWVAGGDTVSSVARIDFSTLTKTTPASVMSQSRSTFTSFSSNDYAYFGGGYIPGGNISSIVDRLNFATETFSPAPVLNPARTGHFSATNSN